MPEDDLRRIFARLNRNVVALNEQELRNATYWGPFISLAQKIADDDPFWAESGIFSANDHRRMLDHEFISELMAAFLHGPMNKKDKLDHYYQLYEQEFEDRDRVEAAFRAITAELGQVLPELADTRWRKKSDFYTLFLSLGNQRARFPLAAEDRKALHDKLIEFGKQIDAIVKMDEEEWGAANSTAVKYARNVVGAASDKGSRVERTSAFDQFVFGAGTG